MALHALSTGRSSAFPIQAFRVHPMKLKVVSVMNNEFNAEDGHCTEEEGQPQSPFMYKF